MSAEQSSKAGRAWFEALTGQKGIVEGGIGSILKADADLGGEKAHFLAVVPDPNSRFPRASKGEMGLEQGWTLAKYVRAIIAADKAEGKLSPIVAIVDIPSQAYGRSEELLGIHLACAAAVDAYATARMAGHPVVALLVGKAMSGAFLAHGYQANRILALDDQSVMVHAMGKAAAARITRRSVDELDELGNKVLPMSYDIRNYAKLGLLHKVIKGVSATSLDEASVQNVRGELKAAVDDTRAGKRDLSVRLESEAAKTIRHASIEVRKRLIAQWPNA